MCIIAGHAYPDIHIAANRINYFAKLFSRVGMDVDLWIKSNKISDEKTAWNGITIHRLSSAPFVMPGLTKDRRLLHHKVMVALKIFIRLLEKIFGRWDKKVVEATGDRHYDYIISSFGPVEAVKAGLRLKETRKQAILCLDFRDEFLSDAIHPGFFEKVYRAKLRVAMKSNADLVIGVSQNILAEFDDFSRKQVVMNGFDFAVDGMPYESGTKMRIRYAGSFYGYIGPGRFYRALSQLVCAGLIDEDRIMVEILGAKPCPAPRRIEKMVHFYDRIPYEDAVEFIKSADVLLLVLPRSRRKGVYGGKIFDYIGSGRPVLGIVDPDDVAHTLLIEAGNSYPCDSESESDIRSALLLAYNEWISGSLRSTSLEYRKRYHRESQGEKLLARLSSI